MNTHSKLTMHLERHMYKRGAYRGDAPADSARRSKSHFRVIKGNGGQMIVRMHQTDILTAYADGRVTLNTNGWHTSPTTRACMDDALNFTPYGGFMRSVRKWSMSQTGITVLGKTYAYYDGMSFSADGVPDALIEFEKKVTDKAETKEFRDDVKASGFAGVFPVLYATVDKPTNYLSYRTVRNAITCEYSSHHWPDVVGAVKFSEGKKLYGNHWTDPELTHKQALQRLLAMFTKNMTAIIKSGVTVL